MRDAFRGQATGVDSHSPHDGERCAGDERPRVRDVMVFAPSGRRVLQINGRVRRRRQLFRSGRIGARPTNRVVAGLTGRSVGGGFARSTTEILLCNVRGESIFYCNRRRQSRAPVTPAYLPCARAAFGAPWVRESVRESYFRSRDGLPNSGWEGLWKRASTRLMVGK